MKSAGSSPLMLMARFFWAGTYLGSGYIFSGQIEFIALKSQQLGGRLMVLRCLLSLLYWLQFVARQRFLRELRMPASARKS